MTAPQVPERLTTALAGRYRVERELGAGGMATVYLAEDVKHSRRVAIKVLKPELAAVIGADRFVTEIKTTANLQHPHILPLFDSGEADTYLFYVMPFIEGESLRDRLDRERQLGVDEAVRIARDVADALDYAHRHGVIHRDIKPANILLHDGRPLVADFGIALAISAAGGGRLTETGLSLGTPHYMSPEQASAERDLSARSDVYSLGCVLYEMLAGEPPHTGPNAASILMRILTEQPRPLSDLRATVPLHVTSAVSKAVEKLPADRFESAKAFRDALEDPAFRFTRSSMAATVAVPVAAAPTRGWDTRSKVLAGTTVAFAVAAAWLALSDRSPAPAAPSEVLSFQIADSVGDGWVPVAGPNGWLAYIQAGQAYIRPPGSVTAARVSGADQLQNSGLSFSPDGEWFTYAKPSGEGAILFKAPSRGGNPVSLITFAGPVLSPTWGDDGWIYLTSGPPGRWTVGRVPDTGGAMDTLLRAEVNIPYRYAKVPGQPVLLLGLFSGSLTVPRIIALNLGTRDTSTVVSSAYHPEWLVATNHVLFARNEGSLFAVAFDPRRMATAGDPVPVLDSLGESYPNGRYAVSPEGTLIHVVGRTAGGGTGASYTLRLDNLDGAHETISLPPSDHWDAKISPDGQRLAYVRNDHIWVYDLDLGTHTQLTRTGTRHHNPAWSANGERLAFAAQGEGGSSVDVFVTDSRGGGTVERFGGTDDDDFPSQWLTDSTILIQTQGQKEDILVIQRGAAASMPVLEADWQERNPKVSPDGRWLAYVSTEGGRSDLYVRSWPSLRNRVKISEGTAQMANSSFPLWSNDSRSLIYHQGLQIHAAAVQSVGDSMRVAGRRVLQENVRGILADLHPDGRRFLVLALESASDTAAARAPRRVVVVTNWLSVLRERLGR